MAACYGTTEEALYRAEAMKTTRSGSRRVIYNVCLLDQCKIKEKKMAACYGTKPFNIFILFNN
jgi:hypothetical protein